MRWMASTTYACEELGGFLRLAISLSRTGSSPCDLISDVRQSAPRRPRLPAFLKLKGEELKAAAGLEPPSP